MAETKEDTIFPSFHIHLSYNILELHFLIKVLSFFFVLKVRNKTFYRINNLCFCEIIFGEDAFKKVSQYLKSLDKNSNNYALIGYCAQNTLSENGSAKRGICEAQNGYLTRIVESSVEKSGGKILATPLSGGETFEVEKNQIVSMNIFAFTPQLFKFLEIGLNKFLKDNKTNLEKCEYLIPEVVQDLIAKKISKVKVVNTSAVWYGVTYREDKEKVVQSIKKLVDDGVYPKGLWTK